jgi:hypothetical protein
MSVLRREQGIVNLKEWAAAALKKRRDRIAAGSREIEKKVN